MSDATMAAMRQRPTMFIVLGVITLVFAYAAIHTMIATGAGWPGWAAVGLLAVWVVAVLPMLAKSSLRSAPEVPDTSTKR